MRKPLLALALALAAVSFGAQAAPSRTPIDFTSDVGFHATCAGIGTASPARNASDPERAAFAICASVALAGDAVTWWKATTASGAADSPRMRAMVRAQLASYLPRVTAIRRSLEPIKSRAPLFVVQPGTWMVDLDRDGTVSMQERYLFWVPRHGSDVSPLQPAASEADILAHYQAPVVSVDVADVHWALAYCNFIEAALHLVLSYDVDPAGSSIVLVDRERVRTHAYPRLREGIRESMRLRAALLAETDDDREWIANPSQRDTSFPLVMDAQTFATWGAGLAEVDRLLAGQALLGGPVRGGRGVTELTFGACPEGQGIDVHDLFMNPLVHPLDRAEIRSRCRTPLSRKPMTGLATLLATSIERNAHSHEVSGEWQVLRHLYWVN